jgi:uncharacterized membrane protein
MTGVRIGTVFQSIGAAATGLIIAFSVNWKLTLVILTFTPVIIIAGKFRSQMKEKKEQLKGKGSFVEQGGQVFKAIRFLDVFVNASCSSMQHKQLNIFVLLSLFIKKTALLISMKMRSTKNSSITLCFSLHSSCCINHWHI